MTADDNRAPRLNIRLIGGPTVWFDYAGLNVVTDPTFDPAGSSYAMGPMTLMKQQGPTVDEAQVGKVDLVLLSHDQHPDNLDQTGRRLVQRATSTLTTPDGAERLGGSARGLDVWEVVEIPTPGGVNVRVTAVPAQHGPPGTEKLTGQVTGFVLTAPGMPTVYVSGDNVSLDPVREIAARFGVDVAILHLGGAQLPPFGPAKLSMTADQGTEAARLLGAPHVVPVHCEGWEHFVEAPSAVREAFAASAMSDVLHLTAPGVAVTIS